MMQMLQLPLLVGLGGALGSLCRMGLMQSITGEHAGALAVLVANILGSLAAGVMLGLDLPAWWRNFAVIGVLGGFTTFSSFSMIATTYIERGQWSWAFGYALVSVIGSVGACAVAYSLTKGFAT
ncbi:fluoride efflux transporter CrcB [bacterium]|nr:fluoride efflux transporter CrcB [bacterium]